MANGSITAGWPPSTATGRSRKRTSSASTVSKASTTLRAETVADHHAVDVAGIERARRAFDGERADHADLFADRDRQRRIRAAAAGDQHACLVERIGARQFRQLLAARGERAHAAQYGAVQRADAQRRRQPPHQPLRPARWRRSPAHPASTGRAVVAAARNDRHEQAAALCPLLAQQTPPAPRRAPGRGKTSASTTASGSTEASAVGASAQVASMIGKPPAARNASTTSGAGLSAMTANGPCSAMVTRDDASFTDNGIVSMPKRC